MGIAKIALDPLPPRLSQTGKRGQKSAPNHPGKPLHPFSSNFVEEDYMKCHSDDVDVDLMDHHVKNSLYCVGAMFDIYFF